MNWNNQPQYNNLPTINGIGEHEGKEFTAKDVVNTTNAKEDKLAMDIAGTYPPEAGVVSWKRTNTLLKEKEEVKVEDDYVLNKKPSTLQQTFMTVAKVDVSRKGKVVFVGDKEKLVLSFDEAVFTVTTENPTMVGAEYGKLMRHWDNRVITRVLLTANNPQTKGKLIYSFKKGE